MRSARQEKELCSSGLPGQELHSFWTHAGLVKLAREMGCAKPSDGLVEDNSYRRGAGQWVRPENIQMQEEEPGCFLVKCGRWWWW